MTDKPTAEQVAARFGVRVENIRSAYATNARQLRQMEAQARAEGGAVNGFTADQLAKSAAHAEKLSKEVGAL